MLHPIKNATTMLQIDYFFTEMLQNATMMLHFYLFITY